jgi:hypothetical protein
VDLDQDAPAGHELKVQSMLGLRGNGRRTMESVKEIRAVTASCGPWNKGKLTGPKPPLQPKHVWAL